MALLGFLIFAASVAAAVSIAVSNTDAAAFDVFGETVTDLSPGGLLLLGAGLGVASLLGLWLIAAGLRHSRRRREANRTVVKETRSRVDELEEENIRLREVAARRQTTPATALPPTAMPTTSAAGSSTDFASADADRDRLREERHATPTMATASEPIDLRSTESPEIYPQDPPYVAPGSSDVTPAFDEAAKAQEGRVFGRRNR